MAKLLKLRRGTTSQHGSFTGAEGEVTIDTTKDTAVVHDGSTAGGRALAREDLTNVSSSTIAGRLSNDSIAPSKIGSGTLPSDVTIASINIVDGSIVNSDINAGAGITSGKLAATGVSAGSYGSSSAIPIVTVNAQGQVTAASTTAIDSTTIANGTSNVAVANNGNITATRSGTARLVVDDAGVDVTGNITSTGNIVSSGNIEISGTLPVLSFTDTNNNPDYQVQNNDGTFIIRDTVNNADRFRVNTDGHVDIGGNLDVGSGVDVTGNITVTGTVDGVDVATRDTLFGGLTSSSGVLANGVTATTQAASDNSTKVATTAYVTTGIANAQAFPSGTKMLFQQTSAPTGWTKITSAVNNKTLRVVSGTVGSGGNIAFTTAFGSRGITANAANTTQGGNISVANTTAGGNVSISSVSTSGTVNSHTLSSNEMPSHRHNVRGNSGANYWGQQNSGGGWHGIQNYSYRNANQQYTSGPYTAFYTENEGGGGGHSHGFSGSSHNHTGTLSGSAHTHNASFTGSAHNHSISVTNLDMQVEYLDVIIASKD